MKYLIYDTFDKAQNKIDFITNACKAQGIFSVHTTTFADVLTNKAGTEFYVPYDIARTQGVGFLETDIDKATEVQELTNFPDNEPAKRFQIIGKNIDFLKLIADVPYFAEYRYQLGAIPYYFGEYTLLYRDAMLDEDRVLLEWYLGSNCIVDRQTEIVE